MNSATKPIIGRSAEEALATHWRDGSANGIWSQMLAPRFRLSSSQRSDLVKVCEIGAARIDQITRRISSERLTLRRSKIESIIAEEVGSELGETLGRLVFSIAGSFRRNRSTPAEFLERLDTTLTGDSKEDQRLSGWAECRPAFQHLLETDSVRIAAKAIDISYDFERVYLAGRLLTSIRPVFDEKREELVGSTIVQTLRVEFIAPNGDQSSISIAMDADDIKQLQGECERALMKAEKARSKIEKDCGIEAIIPGEE
jgi:hypothetical protein